MSGTTDKPTGEELAAILARPRPEHPTPIIRPDGAPIPIRDSPVTDLPSVSAASLRETAHSNLVKFPDSCQRTLLAAADLLDENTRRIEELELLVERLNEYEGSTIEASVNAHEQRDAALARVEELDRALSRLVVTHQAALARVAELEALLDGPDTAREYWKEYARVREAERDAALAREAEWRSHAEKLAEALAWYDRPQDLDALAAFDSFRGEQE